ncbi:phosphate uptake regulator PhoU [Candidatus Woesearchaeota archaeon]|nr:phosphate uptake regulator PhoU [Candidatus Woesearchaeota archaeon]
MRRKVIRHGSSTLTISLPSRWAKQHNIQKGDELVVEERGDLLSIQTEREKTTPRYRTSIGSYSRLGKSHLTACYRRGFDEVTFTFEDPAFASVVQDVLKNDIEGYEILTQNKHACTVKHLFDVNKEGFKVALRRLWTLLNSMAVDLLVAIREKDTTTLQIIKERDKTINRLMNYCARALNKYVVTDDNILYYHLLRELEDIGDHYKEIASFYLQHMPQTNDQSLAMFAQVNQYLEALCDVYYTYDKQRVEALFHRTKKLIELMRSHIRKKRETCVTLTYLLLIATKTRGLLSTIVELNL